MVPSTAPVGIIVALVQYCAWPSACHERFVTLGEAIMLAVAASAA
jgi:hypothetical protein